MDYDAEHGRLTAKQALSTLPADAKLPKGGNSGAELEIHPSGKFLYGSNRGHNSIAIFAIDQETGRLTPIGYEPSGGQIPRGFGIDPTGNWLLAANQDSANVVVFRIDRETGKLTPTGTTVEVDRPVCVRIYIPR